MNETKTPEEKRLAMNEYQKRYREAHKEQSREYMRRYQRKCREAIKAAKIGDSLRVMLDDRAFLPERAHIVDAGLDLKSPVDIMVPAKGSAVINTGVHIEIPKNYVGMLKSKSGLNVRNGLRGEGTIDSGYTGAIVVKLYNDSGEDYYISRGDKIIQLVVLPCLLFKVDVVDSLKATERGDNGFGSTGK